MKWPAWLRLHMVARGFVVACAISGVAVFIADSFYIGAQLVFFAIVIGLLLRIIERMNATHEQLVLAIRVLHAAQRRQTETERAPNQSQGPRQPTDKINVPAAPR